MFCLRGGRLGSSAVRWSRTKKKRMSSTEHFGSACQSQLGNSEGKKIFDDLATLSRRSVIGFHTTSPKRAHPLLVLLVIKPLSRVAAAATGWAMKRWWRNLSEGDKLKFKDHFNRNKIKYGGLLLFLMGTAYALYQNNVSRNPYTGRKRFMIYNSTQLAVLAKQKFDKIIAITFEGDSYLPATTLLAEQLLSILNKLLNANSDIREIHTRDWKLYILDNFKKIDVGAFASGQIVFCTGMLKFVDNEDQVAHLLAHEISHVILEHHAEHASQEYLLTGLLMLPLTLVWAFIPSNIVAAVSGWIFDKTTEVMITSPYSREQESEADAFSLKLMAKACYDVREASVYWANMGHVMGELDMATTSGKWLSTHPSDAQRQAELDGRMMEAITLRQNCKCPSLPEVDPRFSVWRREKMKVAKVLQETTQKGGDKEQTKGIEKGKGDDEQTKGIEKGVGDDEQTTDIEKGKGDDEQTKVIEKGDKEDEQTKGIEKEDDDEQTKGIEKRDKEDEQTKVIEKGKVEDEQTKDREKRRKR